MFVSLNRPGVAVEREHEPISLRGSAGPAHPKHLVDDPQRAVGQRLAVQPERNAVELSRVRYADTEQYLVYSPDGVPSWKVVIDDEIERCRCPDLQGRRQLHDAARAALRLRAIAECGHPVILVLRGHHVGLGNLPDLFVERAVIRIVVEPTLWICKSPRSLAPSSCPPPRGPSRS